jgi:Leucine-rich repeat (LRR) protein
VCLSLNKIEHIEDGAFIHLENINKELLLDRNNLKSFNSTLLLGNGSNLNNLRLDFNKIESASFESLREFKFLYVSENKLSRVARNTFQGLEKLLLYLIWRTI